MKGWKGAGLPLTILQSFSNFSKVVLQSPVVFQAFLHSCNNAADRAVPVYSDVFADFG